MRRFALVLLLSLSTTAVTQAGSIDLALNDEAARIGFGWPLAGEWLQTDAAWFHHDENGDVVTLGLHAIGDATFSERLEGGIGANAFWVDAELEDGWGLAIGGFFKWGLTRKESLSLTAEAHVAPDIFAGGDIKSYLETGARVGYKILTSADVFAGYRYIELDPQEGDDIEVASDLEIGFRMEF